MDTLAKFCVFRKIAFEMLVIIISPVYYYMCARSAQTYTVTFWVPGYEKLPAFFLARSKRSVFKHEGRVSSINIDAL